MINTDPIQLAIVGCGAIAELGHLPDAANCPDVQVTVLVDRDTTQARQIAGEHGIPHVLDDYRQITKYASAAVVALPPYLHAPVTIDLLNHGIHVLVEKPMAIRVEECDRMIEAAQSNRAVLAVGLARRFGATWRFARKVIDEEVLGRIKSFEVQEGDVFGWPVTTPFFLTREEAGGGVLADAGVHVLDALLWWFGDVKSLQYYDDDYGGVEANCKLELAMANGVKGTVELTRTHATPNSTVIHGERGSLTVKAFSDSVRLEMDGDFDGERLVLDGPVLQVLSDSSVPDLKVTQLSDFAAAIRTGQTPVIDGVEGRRSVDLMEQCYALRRPMRLPWDCGR